MDNNQQKHIPESLFFILALLVGLSLRLLFLGNTPLSEPEANLALQALDVAKGSAAPIGPHPLYLLLTGSLFFLLGNDNFLARFLPALVGSLFILAPVLFRQQLGRKAAIILALGLAIDPGLVSLSRQASDTILGLAFVVFAVGFWNTRKPIVSGICAALALLGGPMLWQGLLGVAISALIYFTYFKSKERSAVEPLVSTKNANSSTYWGLFWLSTGISLGLVATLFMRFPRGLSSLAGSLPAYIMGWGSFSGVAALTLLVALVVYQLPALIFGAWRGIRSWLEHDTLDKVVSIWFVVGFISVLVYPSRNVADLAWVSLPLWILAARGLALVTIPEKEDRLPAAIFSFLVVVLGIFAWLNFTGLLDTWQLNTDILQFRSLAILGAVLLLALATFMVAWGWSWTISLHGLTYGGIVLLFIFMVSNMTSAPGLRAHGNAELWQTYPIPRDQRYLFETVGQLSEWNTGRKDAVQIVVAGISSDALRWAMRGMPNAEFTPILAPGSQPPLVITMQQQQPGLAASYRGEEFVWDEQPDWQSLDVLGRLTWIAYHTAPLQSQKIILWARADIFPDHTTAGATAP